MTANSDRLFDAPFGRGRHVVAAVALVAIVALCYAPGLSGGFLFDDQSNILVVEGLRIGSLEFESLLTALQSGGAGPTGRPVSQLTFALNYYFSGFDSLAFKLTNLTIHGLSGVLVYMLALRLIGTANPALDVLGVRVAAGLAAAAWMLHPIQLLAVLHVVQRMTSLSALFLFAALLLHVRGRERGPRRGWLQISVAWGILWPLSVLSKEIGVLFPFFVLAYEFLLRRQIQGSLDRIGIGSLAVSAAIFAGAIAYIASPSGAWLFNGFEMRAFTLYERVLTEGRVVWLYLWLIFFPKLGAFGLYHDDIPISEGILTPITTVLSVLGFTAVILGAWFVRKRAPILSFAAAWFLVGHSLESTILPLELAHEHRNYIPLFGLMLATGQGFGALIGRAGTYRTVGWTLAACSLCYLALITALRADLYGDNIRRSQIEVQYHPESASAQFEAGRALNAIALSAGAPSPLWQFVEFHYRRAGELDPTFKLGLLGIIQANCQTGIRQRADVLAELLWRLEHTPFAPGDRNVLHSVKEMSKAGALCLARSDVQRIFDSALENPTAGPSVKAIILSWLADYLTLTARDLAAARDALDRSLALVPGNPSNRLKRAQLAYLEGNRDEAADMLVEVRKARFSPAERETYKELVACLEARDTSMTCVAL